MIEKITIGLMTENNREAKKKEVAQKDSTLEPITKVNSKLDKELRVRQNLIVKRYRIWLTSSIRK